ncbi:hypothetical protein ACPW7Z_02000 [Bifidobacterium adolescentis]|uniref:hypothetical protein n=1 Tax=Bifidobacterium adolescentis TaxID=1680 RepID=UPI003CE597D8
MNDLDELNFTPLPPVTDQDLAMVRGVVNSNRLHMIKGLASVPLSEEFDFLGCDGRPIRIPDSVVYGQINVYGVTTKSERHKRSYWTRTADGNGIGGRKAPVPYGS